MRIGKVAYIAFHLSYPGQMYCSWEFLGERERVVWDNVAIAVLGDHATDHHPAPETDPAIVMAQRVLAVAMGLPPHSDGTLRCEMALCIIEQVDSK